MEKRTDFYDFIDKIQRQDRYIEELEEENKTLKEKISELEDVSEDYDLLSKDFIALWEENKKLNIKVASLEWEIKWLNSVIDKLKEENQTLELWLDNKEKLNEKYRKEIEGLKSDLSECECSFWFEMMKYDFGKESIRD